MLKKLFKRTKVQESQTPSNKIYLPCGIRGTFYVENEDSIEYLKREDIKEPVYFNLDVDELDEQSLLNLEGLGVTVEYLDDKELCMILPPNMILIQNLSGDKGYFMDDRVVGMITPKDIVRFIQSPNTINLVVTAKEFTINKSFDIETIGGLLAAVDYCSAMDYDESNNTIYIKETDGWEVKMTESDVSFMMTKDNIVLIKVVLTNNMKLKEGGVTFFPNIVTDVKKVYRKNSTTKYSLRLSVYKVTKDGNKYIGGSFIKFPKEGEGIREAIEERLEAISPGYKEEPFRYW